MISSRCARRVVVIPKKGRRSTQRRRSVGEAQPTNGSWTLRQPSIIWPCWKSWRKRCVKKTTQNNRRAESLEALKKESERALTDLIRRRLAMPLAKRMNFLRVRLPGGGSHL